MKTKISIPLVDLVKSQEDMEEEIKETINDVLKKGVFILGENVHLFEKEFASYLGARFGVGVGCGTDAITLSLRALGIGEEDEVIIPANSYPTAFGVAASGARIRLADVDPYTFNIDPKSIEKTISVRAKAVVVVHLYGQACEMDGILKIAKRHKLFVVEDVAQAHGASFKRKKLGTLGDVGCFSFYPTKNLGCLGDGGMVVTNNKRLAGIVRELRMYGETRRYQSRRLGVNSRLDELQASVLRVKLRKLDEQNKLRQKIAMGYFKNLKDEDIILPTITSLGNHVYHLFVIRTKKRDYLRQYLKDHGVETGVHFPNSIHEVKSFAYLGYKRGDFLNAEKTAREILSLPCYPGLSLSQVRSVCHLVKNALR